MMNKAQMESSASSKTAALDSPLHTLGFEVCDITPKRVTGRLVVNEKCIQPFKVLHGGVSALIAEGLASMGAHLVSGFRRVAGVQLCINHVKSAQLGEEIFAEAEPVNVGRTIQVWDVRLWRVNSSSRASEDRALISTSRVTLIVNLPVADHLREAGETLRRHAKL